jgi:hypothetical protein
MARKTGKELETIKKKYNVDTLWSWSKYNTYKNSCYEFYLKYIKKIKEDRQDGIYAVSGGMCHDIIEKLYSNQIKYEEMLQEYESSLLDFNLAELKYNRTDDDKNDKIAQKYEYCIKHFFRNHIRINRKVDTERFIIIKVGSFIFQGYIDFIYKDGNNYVITDWKTSSIYTGKKIDKEKGQLVLYAEGLRQLEIPLENIKIRWNFLKYVTVQIQQANGEVKDRNISRNEIGESLQSNAKMWLKKEKKYSDEEIEKYLDLLVLTNDIDCLPKSVQSKYKINDCYVYIPFTQDEIDSLKEDIIKTIAEISMKEIEYIKTHNENVWDEEITDEKSYYFANLSGYSAKLNKSYARYLDNLNLFKNKENNDAECEDMSWLNEI